MRNLHKYLTTFAYQFGSYQFTRLPFRVALDGDVNQQKVDEIFQTYKMFLVFHMSFYL